MKANHVMIDLETMGITPDSAVVSIGAVVFDPRFNHVSSKTFYRELDWSDQRRFIDPETRKWWSTSTPLAQNALNGLEDLTDALTELAVWLPKDAKVWGNL